jgi:uncharacterized protein (TIGR02246 family)
MKSIRGVVVISALVTALAACAERAADPSPAADTAADVAAIEAVLERIEQTFTSGDLDAGMTIFTDDAVIMGQGAPDVAGREAIRAGYEELMSQFDIAADLRSEEIEIDGDLAYERGTYTLKLTQKSTGQVVTEVENRYVHIFKRQPDGGWKEWRMMVNSAEAPLAAP